jgi:gas vesicle protein
MSDRVYYSQEAAQQAAKDRTILALFVLGIGVGVGAAISLLAAPRSGEATRKMLSNQAEHLVEGGRETTTKALESILSEIARLRRDLEERVA